MPLAAAEAQARARQKRLWKYARHIAAFEIDQPFRRAGEVKRKAKSINPFEVPDTAARAERFGAFRASASASCSQNTRAND